MKYILFVAICKEVLSNDQNREKNDQATHYNLQSSAAVKFVSTKELGTWVKLRKRYTRASWAG